MRVGAVALVVLTNFTSYSRAQGAQLLRKDLVWALESGPIASTWWMNSLKEGMHEVSLEKFWRGKGGRLMNTLRMLVIKKRTIPPYPVEHLLPLLPPRVDQFVLVGGGQSDERVADKRKAEGLAESLCHPIHGGGVIDPI